MGQYPLFDVSVRIADLEKMNALHEQMKNMTMDAMMQASKLLNVGNMTPNTAITRNDVRWDLPTEVERMAYNIFINARNGNFVQTYNFRRVNGHWKRAYRVFRQAAGEQKPLYEWANDDYPRNDKGEIEWFE